MPRQHRNDMGGKIYHVINRANARVKIFENDSDYELFEAILSKAVKRFTIKLFSYTNMPNHFHLVIYSEKPHSLSKFMQWFGGTFAQYWHMRHGTIGTGHLFQGRYKSFPINNDNHLLQVLLYVERNALRASLVKKAEDWRWSSIWIRKYGNKTQKEMLSDWPIEIPNNYLTLLNNESDKVFLNKIRKSIEKGTSIDSIERRRGRPKKGSDPF